MVSAPYFTASSSFLSSSFTSLALGGRGQPNLSLLNRVELGWAALGPLKVAHHPEDVVVKYRVAPLEEKNRPIALRGELFTETE